MRFQSSDSAVASRIAKSWNRYIPHHAHLAAAMCRLKLDYSTFRRYPHALANLKPSPSTVQVDSIIGSEARSSLSAFTDIYRLSIDYQQYAA